MVLSLFKHHYPQLRTHRVTRVVECLNAPALWRGTLWLAKGLAVFSLALAASLTLSAPPPAAQQAGPPAPQAPQSRATGTPAGEAVQAEQAAPKPSQLGPTPPAPQQTAPGSQTTPAEQAPPATPPGLTGGPGVGFRLENADLLQFVNLVAGELKLNYVVDPAVRGAVTISTAGELRPEDLFPILESVLKMNNATAIKTGNFYRIVPLAAASKNPLAVSPQTRAAELPADDRMLLQIIPLKFVFAVDMAKLLTPFLSEGGHVDVLEAGNTLLLVDDSLNLKRLMGILEQFDNSSFIAQRVRLFPVRYNVASALVSELTSVFATYAFSEKQTPLRFLPLDRINGILVAAPDPAAFGEVEQWIVKLDQPVAPNGIQTFVYKVQYSEADRLVHLLTALRGAGGVVSEGETGAAGRPREAGRGGTGPSQLLQETLPQSSSESPLGSSLFGASGGPGTGAASPTLRIITDAVSNSIVVQCTAQEYSEIARTLDKLDTVPRQVLIEARVYEVDLTGNLSFGLEYALQAHGTAAGGGTGLTSPTGLQFSGGFTSGSLGLSAGGVIGYTRELMTYLTASENRTRVRTLSAPTLLTTDSSTARIQVGASVPVLTSQGLTQGGQVAGSSLYTSTVNNVDTGIILSVTPRITSTGLVSLTINQEISNEVPPASGAGIQSPSFSKRAVTTHAVAQDGQTIALGGLISYNYNKTVNRVPLLGDIPLIGALFGSTSYNTTETELIVLLTPRIISTLPGATAATRELEDRLNDLRREFKKDQLLKP